MYTVVLAVALASGGNAPDFFFHKLHAPPACPGGVGCPGYGYGIHPYAHGLYGGRVLYDRPAVWPPTYGPAFPGAGLEGAFACVGGYGCYGACEGGFGCYGLTHSFGHHPPAFPPGLHVPTLPPAAVTPGLPVQPATPGQPPRPEPIPELPKPDKERETGADLDHARLVVEVPADAKLFVDGHPTRATDAVRSFRTPRLDRGDAYYYTVRAEVEVDGKVVAQTRRVVVRAGDVVRERFDDPRAVKTAGAWVAVPSPGR